MRERRRRFAKWKAIPGSLFLHVPFELSLNLVCTILLPAALPMLVMRACARLE